MKTAEITAKGAIYFERIQDGFDAYIDEKIIFSEEEAFQYFQKKIEEYGRENVFADFYYHTLPDEAKARIESSLEKEEVEYLRQMTEGLAGDELVFPLEDELLPIVVKLNAEEMLFSTIYFLENGGLPRMTWWGNYQKEYYCFKDKH